MSARASLVFGPSRSLVCRSLIYRSLVPAILCCIPLTSAAWALGCASEVPMVSVAPDPSRDDMDPENPELIAGGKADQQTADWPANGPVPERCATEVPLQVLFAPEDPTASLERDLIGHIRELRRADKATYSEGHNPFSIHYAVYNLTHQGIITDLLDAEREGIDVQVLIEADQLMKPWGRVDDRFRDAGLEVHLDHHAISEAERETGDLIGIDDRGLMHLKARLFEAPGFRRVLSGSLNPNQSSGANEETLHLIADSALIDRYAETMRRVLYREPLQNSFDDTAAVNVMFTPVQSGERASTRLLKWLEQEQEQILLMVFSLRNVQSAQWDTSLLQILKAKHAAGVPVYVITDRKQSDGVDAFGHPKDDFWDDWFDTALHDAGIPTYECLNTAEAFFGSPNPYAAMHQKTAVLGRTRIRVISDAANWTRSGLGDRKHPARNVESMLFIDTEALDGGLTGRRYLAQWLRVLKRYADQSPAEPDFETVQRTLFGLSGWPSQTLGFVAQDAITQPGESIHVLGALDALGAWGQQGEGLWLVTDSAHYPTWWSEVPLDLPLGTAFGWKLTRWGAHALLAWENGADRPGMAAPLVCPDRLNPPVLEATWR